MSAYDPDGLYWLCDVLVYGRSWTAKHAYSTLGIPETSRKESVVGGLTGLIQGFLGSLNRTIRMRV